MKTAIYIDDGRMQVVLTPDNEQEHAALKFMEKNLDKMSVYRGRGDGATGIHPRPGGCLDGVGRIRASRH